MGAHRDEPMARVGIGRILEKVTAMESTLAVQACAIQAFSEDIKELSARMGSMEENRFPWKVIGGMVAVGAFVVSLVVAFASTGTPPPPHK